MADLADFFAKKDKKKSKPKKFVPEEMAQKLEDAEKKQQERERRQELKREVLLREEQLEIDGAEKKKEAVEEWQEVEEEVVDLTDLNIKDLQQPEPERHSADKGSADEGSASAEQSGPWNKSKDKRQRSPEESEPTKAAETTPAPAAAPAAAATAAAAPQKYVAPGARRAMESSGSHSAGGFSGRSRWSNKAPNIADDAAFPSLGTAVETSSRPAWGQKPGRLPVEPFRQVRGSSGSKDQRIAQPNKLSLGNQFDALQLSDAY